MSSCVTALADLCYNAAHTPLHDQKLHYHDLGLQSNLASTFVTHTHSNNRDFGRVPAHNSDRQCARDKQSHMCSECQVCACNIQGPLLCPSCGAVNYCSSAHRKQHWVHVHHEECDRMRTQMSNTEVRSMCRCRARLHESSTQPFDHRLCKTLELCNSLGTVHQW